MSHEGNDQLIEQLKESRWVFTNISQLDASMFDVLKEHDVEYSFIEYDYKMCKHRNPVLYEFVEGEKCDYAETELGQNIKDFMLNAKSVFFMSEKQKQIYCETFSELNNHNTHVLSSMFNDQSLDYIQKLNEKEYEREKWVVLNSNSWVKGVDASEQWCKDNNLEYELVGGLGYIDFLKKMRRAKGGCFMPDGLDTCPRFVIEAKLLGCELQLNENVQHVEEEWFTESSTHMVSYLRSRKDYFWQKAFN